MDEEYNNSNSEYATVGHVSAQPWEILPIWLYLVSLTTTTLSLKEPETNNQADSPPLSPLRPPSLHPLPLQTHPPNPLPLQPMARMQQPRSAPVRTRKPPPNNRANPRRLIDPLVRRIQRRYPLRGDHAGALCQ